MSRAREAIAYNPGISCILITAKDHAVHVQSQLLNNATDAFTGGARAFSSVEWFNLNGEKDQSDPLSSVAPNS